MPTACRPPPSPKPITRDGRVVVFHDENGNGELDLGQFRIPVEPYGFSNDAPVMMGPPSWKKAAFDVGSDGARQRITLR